MIKDTIKSNRILSWASGILLAAAGGILLSLAFPPAGRAFLAWFGLVPVLASVFLFPRVQGAVNAAVGGILYYILLYLWMQRFHRLSILFISLLFGLLFFALPLVLARWGSRKNLKAGFLLVPALWVVFEYLKTRGPLSFGFGILGYSQYTLPRIIQSADIFGVYGVSFLLVFINFTLFYCLYTLVTRRGRGGFREWGLPLIGAALIAGLFLGYGQFQLTRELVSRDLRVQLAQFHHDSRADWGAMEEKYLDEYEELTGISREFQPDLVIFPENAVKRYVSLNPQLPLEGSARILNRISAVAADADTALLLGVLESEGAADGPRRFNTAFLFDRDGSLSGRYRKMHLVPFGETDPFNGAFPALEEMLTTETDVIRLDRGEAPRILSVSNRRGEEFRFGTLICFEGTRGDFVRNYSREEGVDFLVNITSDAWTRSAGALEQHAAFCVFRAVENRKTLYRVGNGGLSGVINPKGVMVKRLPYFTRGVLLSGLIVPEDGSPGLYVRWGDWFVGFCLGGVLLLLGHRIVLKTKRRAPRAVSIK